MKLSIITINYNNAEGLKRTLESVAAQTDKEFEHIIVDGASADESVEVIKEYVAKVDSRKSKVDRVKWVSEPDTGIYNAMNKGLKMAHGEYVLMLNSGDFLVDEHVIERIMPELHTEDMIQGNLIKEYKDKNVRDNGYGRSELSFFDVMDANFLHQAMFIKLRTMAQYGYYDDSYKKGGDTYFLITALGLGNATYRYVDIDVANFDMNGITNNPMWQQIDKEEDARWYGEHISKRLWDLYQTAPKKIRLYDQLHKHKFIWKLTMGLVRISEWLSPTEPNIKKELVNR